jgi:LemA protein
MIEGIRALAPEVKLTSQDRSTGGNLPHPSFSATFKAIPNEARMSFFTAAWIVLLVTSAVIYTAIVYNGLIRLQNDVSRAWANIDVLLKQRHDEIPNVVACVKGYMDHERQTLEAVTAARAVSISAFSIPQKAQADVLLTGAMRSLFAVAEQYPKLEADQNFLELQKRISSLEERIADRREFFNDGVNTYNRRIAQFPEIFLSQIMKLEPRQLFQVNEQERQPTDMKIALARGAAGR